MLIYKAFLRPLLILEISSMTKLKMNLFVKKLELVQYKAALAITGAIQGTSRDKV